MAINKKQKGNNKAIYLVIVLVAFLLLVVFILSLNKSADYQNKKPETLTEIPQKKTYFSKAMKLSIDIPEKFKIEDTGITLTLTSNTEEITIVRNGTQFANLESYLNNFDSKRGLIVSESKKAIINNNDSMMRIIKFPQQNVEQKSYYIYVNNSVYIISTKSEALYSVLDQIARSFRYAP